MTFSSVKEIYKNQRKVLCAIYRPTKVLHVLTKMRKSALSRGVRKKKKEKKKLNYLTAICVKCLEKKTE